MLSQKMRGCLTYSLKKVRRRLTYWAGVIISKVSRYQLYLPDREQLERELQNILLEANNQ